MDDVGIDQMRIFGYGGGTPPLTPNIDSVARAGVRFSHALLIGRAAFNQRRTGRLLRRRAQHRHRNHNAKRKRQSRERQCAGDATAVRPLVAYATFYRDGAPVFESEPLGVNEWDAKSRALPIRLAVSPK